MAGDIPNAIRQWARTPVITAVVVLSLALGIGANTAIFSLIDSLLLRPLPVANPGELVRIHEEGYSFQSYPVWQYIRTETSFLGESAAVSLMRPDISSSSERRSALGLAVSGSFFGTLGVGPVTGRLIAPDDDRPGPGSDVVVLEYEFWQRMYRGGDVLGQTIPLDGRPFTIIGVVERGFFGLNAGRRFDLAIPLEGFKTLSPGMADPLSASLTVFGRIAPGRSLGAATSELQAAQAELRATMNLPDTYRRLQKPLTLVPMAMGLTTTTQERYARPLWILMALVGLVLLIACANVANLLLARGAARRAELATRLALGASRAQVLRPQAVESLVIALAGAAVGVIVGVTTARAIVSAVAVDQANALATWIDVSINGRMLAFTSAAGIATALVCGLGPALWNTRVNPIDAMRERARGIASSGARFGIAHLLVAMQVALAFVLVLGGALLVRSFINFATQDLGFERGPLIVAVPDYTRSTVRRADRVPVADRIREELASVPGVRATGFSESTPFGFGLRPWPVIVQQRTAAEGDPTPISRVGTGYFATLGMRMVAGRPFLPTGLESVNTAIVNEAFHNRYFEGTNPIGQAITVRMPRRGQVEIVGVVADARDMSVRDPVPPTVYMPLMAADEPWIEIGIRPAVDDQQLRQRIVDTVSRHAPGASVEFRTVEEGLHNAASRERVIAWLAGGFGVLALLLSAIGVYGVTSYHTSRRRQEFGVRIAVGAAPASVAALIMRQTGLITGVGIAMGLLVALAGARVLASLLFNVSTTDPISTTMAMGLLMAVCLAAGYLPARRAARVDPMTALREE